MKTSYFGGLKKVKPPLYPVAICRSIPKWYTGRVYQKLAPTFAELQLGPEEFDTAYAARLAELDPREVWEQLGPDAVLICFEKPGEPCHRCAVAKWLEAALGVSVPELTDDAQPSLFD